MPMRFPSFGESRCMVFTACGSLEINEPKILEAIAARKDAELVAPYSKGNVKAFIRVGLGGVNSKHVHVDVARNELFKGEPPATTSTGREIQEILHVFLGQRISAVVFGQFLLGVTELPKRGLIESTFYGTKQGGTAIGVTGATIGISGDPIRKLEWRFVREGSTVLITVEATVETEVSENYLSEQLRLLDSGFRRFVLGESVG
jgi:hypothetical protein